MDDDGCFNGGSYYLEDLSFCMLGVIGGVDIGGSVKVNVKALLLSTNTTTPITP